MKCTQPAQNPESHHERQIDSVIVDLIASTTTKIGLKVLCELDSNKYPKGIAVFDADMQNLNIRRAEFHGEWNYTIAPSSQACEAVIP